MNQEVKPANTKERLCFTLSRWCKETYFKHLRLYDYVLNNKQLCEIKRLMVHVNVPAVAPNLNQALLLGAEESLGYEDEDEELRLEVIRLRDQEAQRKRDLEDLRQK